MFPPRPGQGVDLAFLLEGIRVLKRPEHMGQSSSLSSTEHLLLLRALTLLLRIRFRSKWQKTPQNTDVGNRDMYLLLILEFSNLRLACLFPYHGLF